MIVQDLNFDQTVAMAKAKAESMIQNGLYSRFRVIRKRETGQSPSRLYRRVGIPKTPEKSGNPIRIGPDRFPIPSLR